jgi:stress response protein SCP2
MGGQIALGLGWDMLPGGRHVDVDASCVAVDARGCVLMDETVGRRFGSSRSAGRRDEEMRSIRFRSSSRSGEHRL